MFLKLSEEAAMEVLETAPEHSDTEDRKCAIDCNGNDGSDNDNDDNDNDDNDNDDGNADNNNDTHHDNNDTQCLTTML